jgi:hypothetical protein
MKNAKVVFMGMLALALIFGLVMTGCDTPIVGGNEDAVKVEGTVKVGNLENSTFPKVAFTYKSLTTDKEHFVLEWNALADVYEYELLFRKVGAGFAEIVDTAYDYNYGSYNDTLTNGYQFAHDSALKTTQYDLDKWSSRIDVGDIPSILSAGDYEFGVRVGYNTGGSSDVEWTGKLITATAVANPYKVATPTLNLGTDDKASATVAATVSWTGLGIPATVAGQAYTGFNYNVYLFLNSANGTFLSNAVGSTYISQSLAQTSTTTITSSSFNITRSTASPSVDEYYKVIVVATPIVGSYTAPSPTDYDDPTDISQTTVPDSTYNWSAAKRVYAHK